MAGGSPLKEGLSVSQSRLPEAVCFYALCLPVHRGADTRRTAVMSYRKNAREFHFAIPCTDSHIISFFFSPSPLSLSLSLCFLGFFFPPPVAGLRVAGRDVSWLLLARKPKALFLER